MVASIWGGNPRPCIYLLPTIGEPLVDFFLPASHFEGVAVVDGISAILGSVPLSFTLKARNGRINKKRFE